MLCGSFCRLLLKWVYFIRNAGVIKETLSNIEERETTIKVIEYFYQTHDRKAEKMSGGTEAANQMIRYLHHFTLKLRDPEATLTQNNLVYRRTFLKISKSHDSVKAHVEIR